MVEVKLTDYHYQIRDKYIVNFYPSKKTFYVNGAHKKGFYNNKKELIAIAKGEAVAPVSSKLTKRMNRGTRSLRKSLFLEGVTKCFVCNGELENWEKSTLEHKIPLSKGGSNRRDNLSLSHKECNLRKGNEL